MNPLYGLDTYTGQFTRPAGAAANNIYNLADFMLGLRSQYALSTFFVAEMRQKLHFVYLQDDIRVNDKLTVNAGLRYEYATPMWEANNAADQLRSRRRSTMITATDGSIADRALVDPDRNNFGPRLGFAYTPMAQDRRPRRLGHRATCTSTASDRRTCSAINGPQVVRAAVDQGDPTAATFRADRAGLSGRADRSVDSSTR